MRSASIFILRRVLYHPRRMWKWYRVYPIEIIGCYCFLHKSPLLRTNRKPQFIATVFTPITKRLSVFYCICGILIAAIVVGQLDLVNSFGEADRESYINRATAVTCISPLRLRTYGYPCKMCSASVFVVKFKIYTRKRFNARINVVRISNMMGDDGIARSWKSDWEPNSGIVVSFASDDNSPLQIENRPAGA